MPVVFAVRQGSYTDIITDALYKRILMACRLKSDSCVGLTIAWITT